METRPQPEAPPIPPEIMKAVEKEEAKRLGGNPNNKILRLYHICRIVDKESGKIRYEGYGLDENRARWDAIMCMKRATGKRVPLHLFLRKGESPDTPCKLYEFEHSAVTGFLPKRLAKTFPQYGKPYRGSGRLRRKMANARAGKKIRNREKREKLRNKRWGG